VPFFVGPLGGLRALPSPHRGDSPDATATRIGAIHRSITGRPTLDRLATRRAWTLAWPYLDPDTYAYLDALHQGLVTGPLWLIDPSRPNRLPPSVAATGSADKSVDGFTAAAGALAWAPRPALGTGMPLAGGVTWQAPGAASRLDTAPIIPLLPRETVTFSATIATTRPVQLVLSALSGASTQITEHKSPEATPGPAGTRLELTVTPAADVVACRVGISTATSPQPGTIVSTAWQLEAAPFATAWRPGGGAPQVLVDSLPVTYPLPGSYTTTLTLLEV
jgi:hypothetical protein